MDGETIFQQAVTTFRAGHKDEAHRLFQQVVRENSQHEQAWFWLSLIAETDEQRIEYLERALQLNPHNSAAQKGLAQIRTRLAGVPTRLRLPSPSPAENPCPACGFDNSAEAQFCGQCGQNQVTDTLPEGGCPGCGFDNQPEAQFCGQCGQHLETETPPTPQPQPSAPPANVLSNSKSKVKSNGWPRSLWIAVNAGLMVILLVICSLIGWITYQNFLAPAVEAAPRSTAIATITSTPVILTLPTAAPTDNAPPTPTATPVIREQAVINQPVISSDDAQNKQTDVTQNLLAFYKFNGSAVDEVGLSNDFLLHNTEFVDNTLFLNGKYHYNGRDDGYITITEPTQFNYQNFTVALDFYALSFDSEENQTNILTGGTFHRWFGLHGFGGYITLTLDDYGFVHNYYQTGHLEENKWHNIICSVDLSHQTVVTMLDGQLLEEIQLPQDFTLSVIGSDREELEKQFTFTNYGNGGVFFGYVDNLRVFGKSMSASEIEELYPMIAIDTPTSHFR